MGILNIKYLSCVTDRNYLDGVFLLTNINSAPIQAFHGDDEALSFLTKPVGDWNGTIFKYHRPGRLGVPTHLEIR